LGVVNSAFSTAPLADDWVLRKVEMTFEPVEGVDVVEDGEEGEGIREDKVEGLFKLVDALEIESDVTQVWTNLAK
jgi:transcriptional/translational regulatory protein YebC/TACO1